MIEAMIPDHLFQVIGHVLQEPALALVARRLMAGVGGAAETGVNCSALGAARLFEGRDAPQPLHIFMQRPGKARLLEQPHPATVGQDDERPSILDHGLSPAAWMAAGLSLPLSQSVDTDRDQGPPSGPMSPTAGR